MPTMIISSPSFAGLQSGACSPNRFSSNAATTSSPFAAASRVSPAPAASSYYSSSPFAAPAVPNTATADSASSPSSLHHAASRSLLSQGVEELRVALKKHTVDATSQDPAPGPSGDHSRGCMSAGPDTLGGGSRTSINNNNNNNNNASDDASMQPSSQPQPAQLPIPASVTSAAADAKGKRQLSDDLVEEQNTATITETTPNIETKLAQPEDESEQSRLKRLRPPLPAVKLLPRKYEFAHPNDLVILISSMIMELIQYNDTIPLRGGHLTRFHSRTPPRISVQDYLQRLTTHATLSPPILLSMVYYIDRLCALYPAFTVSSLTVHRFLITSATVASKGLSDSFWTNKTYARVGGITITELALLELDFLWRVEWKIVPQPEVLDDYYLSLVERCEGYALEPEEEEPEATSTSSIMEHMTLEPTPPLPTSTT